MIKTYLKVAFRNFKKSKGFTAINVLGLSVGLAICLLMLFYIVSELNYDRYNTKADRIFRINIDMKFNGNVSSYAAVEPPLADAIRSNFPEVEKVIRFRQPIYSFSEKIYVKKGSEDIRENKIIFADSGLFDVFTLPFIDGNPSTSLNDPFTAVISESAAKKYFNTTEVVGKMLTINDTNNYRITGVMHDMPKQSHIHYDFLLSSSTLPEFSDHNWNNGGWNTYILLKPGVDYKKLESAIQRMTAGHTSDLFRKADNYLRHSLTPLTDIHLRSERQQELEPNGSIEYVYMFSAIAIFILLIACVNFMNLATARSAKRAREVGVRKVLGAARKSLMIQFLTESVLMTFASAIVAVFLAWLLMPLFNEMCGKDLAFTLNSWTWLAPFLLIVVIVIGLIAGAYPALYLSSFQPIQVLKGKISAGYKGSFLRNFLVVFQFSISIFLIVGTLVIYNQLNYIRTRNLGYDRNQVLIIKGVDALGNQADLLKQELRQLPDVVNTTLSAYFPTGEDRNTTALFSNKDVDLKKAILTEFWPVDEDYINTLGMELIAGRNFSNKLATDSSAIIVNEAYVKLLKEKDPLNKEVYRNSYGVQQYHIVGIIKNFHFNSLRESISPLALVYSQERGAICARIKTTNIPSLLSQIENIWKKLSPSRQFEYSFMDQDFDAIYQADRRVGEIFILFTALAISLACLGLFGLAAYDAEQREKEIGIRKVLGASVSTIVGMLTKDFVKLVFIAILIASPIAWFLMQKWLQDFAYRTNIQWWVLPLAGCAAILIAFTAISFQSIKAALTNPVKTLKRE